MLVEEASHPSCLIFPDLQFRAHCRQRVAPAGSKLCDALRMERCTYASKQCLTEACTRGAGQALTRKRKRCVGLTIYQHRSTGTRSRSDRDVPGRSFISRKNLEPGASSRRDPGNFFSAYVRGWWSFRFEVVQEKANLVGVGLGLDLQSGTRVPHPASNMQLLGKAVYPGTKPDALYESA